MTINRACIKCGQPFQRNVVADVEIDSCSQCGSIWLDSGELRQLATAGAAAELRQLAYAPLGSDPHADFSSAPCPACAGKLASAHFDHLTLEHCTDCYGLFVEHAELDKAMQLYQGRGSTIMALAHSVSMAGWVGA